MAVGKNKGAWVNEICEPLSEVFAALAEFVLEVGRFPLLVLYCIVLMLDGWGGQPLVIVFVVGVFICMIDYVLQPFWTLLAQLVALPLFFLSWVCALGSSTTAEGPAWLRKNTRPGRQHIPRRVRNRVYRKAGGRCVYCGSTKELQIDHIIPVSRGGSSDEANLQLLCGPCNRRKGARFP